MNQPILNHSLHGDWPLKTLGEVTRRIRNGTTTTQNQERLGVPVTRIETISGGVINLERCGFADASLDRLHDYVLRPGDILFSHINSLERIGNCAIYDGSPETLVHGMNLLRIEVSPNLVLPDYLVWYLRSNRARSFYLSTARRAIGQASINIKDISAMPIPVPTLSEQQRIVAKLDEQMVALDRAEKALAEQREAATTLRSTVIRATLDPATHITWPTYPLGDLLEKICNGVSALQNQDKIGLPVTRIETISTGSIDTDRVGYLNLPADHLRDHLLEPGDILFSHINSFERIGNCAVYSGTPNRLVHGMNLLRFKPKRSLVAPEYLLCYLRAPTARAFFSATARRAIGQASINIRDLSVMPIALPPLQIQKSIAEYLDNNSRQTDALVAALGVRVRTLDSLRTSLLNAAFSGEV